MWKVPVFFLDKHTPEQLAEFLKSNKFSHVIVEYVSVGKQFKYDKVELLEGKCVLKLNNQVQVTIDKDYFVYKTSNYLILKQYV